MTIGIIDSHFHLFDTSSIEYPWMETAPERLRVSRDVNDYLRDIEGIPIEQSIFVEVLAKDGQHVQEAAFVQDQADRSGKIAAIVARAPVEQGAKVADELDKLAQNPGLRGIRRGMSSLDMALAPDFIAGVKEVGRRGLVFDIGVIHTGLMFGLELARRCPDVSFVLDHLGTPPVKHGVMDPWRQQMRDYAALPNVVAKISGMMSGVDPKTWTFEQINPYLQHAYECFGPARLMFGTDWPMLLDATSVRGWLDIVERSTVSWSAQDRQSLFRDNAARVYRIAV